MKAFISHAVVEEDATEIPTSASTRIADPNCKRVSAYHQRRDDSALETAPPHRECTSLAAECTKWGIGLLLRSRLIALSLSPSPLFNNFDPRPLALHSFISKYAYK